MVEQLAELLAKERRDDGWRSLVAAQTVGVGGTHDRRLEQSVVAIHSHERLYDERHEAQVLLRRLARGMQQHAIVGEQAPVVVLSRAVDAVEGLLVQQHSESVFSCHLFHQRHEQHIVVDGKVALLVDGS